MYHRGGNEGPSAEELKAATLIWLKANKPEALQSKVEAKFAQLGWSIVWTPPYCPKFQPIELLWGAAKQRAATMYFPGRNMATTKLHLRLGFYGGNNNNGRHWGPVNIAGCWNTAKAELNKWISLDRKYVEDGLSGDLDNLLGVEAWTSSPSTCLNIQDMDVDSGSGVVEATLLVDVEEDE